MGLFLFFEKGGICREGLFCFYLFLLENSLFIGYTTIDIAPLGPLRMCKSYLYQWDLWDRHCL